MHERNTNIDIPKPNRVIGARPSLTDSELDEVRLLSDYLRTLDSLLGKSNPLAVLHEEIIESIYRTKHRIEEIMIKKHPPDR